MTRQSQPRVREGFPEEVLLRVKRTKPGRERQKEHAVMGTVLCKECEVLYELREAPCG